MTSRTIVPDDHRATIEHFLGVLADRGQALGTVVHLGAHEGEEVDAYRRYGAERIVLVEANPDAHRRLAERFGGDGDIVVVHAAASDRSGTAVLQRHTNRRGGTESASLLAMKRLGEIVSTIRTQDAVEVPARTLDDLLAELGIPPSAIGLLALDVQGAELLVLQGAPRSLLAVGAVLCEVALIELYEGAAREPDVDRLLASAGLAPVDALYYELYEGERRFPAWGDRLYLPVSPPATGPREP